MLKRKVLLDLNNEVFQENLFALEKTEANRALKAFSKILKLDWGQLYSDPGLKWEKISSIKPPKGEAAAYSLRITQSMRAIAFRDGDYLRLLAIYPEHDAAYGKN